MIASYLLDPSHTSHGLDALARRELGYDMLTFKEVCGSGRSAVTFDQITVERATRYAAEDAEATYILGELLEEHVENQGLGSLMTDVEIPLSRVLGIMELNGVAVDTTSLARLSDEMAAELASLQTQVTEIGGLEVNINSPKQLQVLLFEHLGLQPIRRTKTGYSTDAEVLYQLASLHPVAAVINDYRTISKLRSTYAEALPKLVNPETGRIHTSYNQAVAATGRLSSSDPNLQNIPIRTKLGKKIRRAFVAPEGKKLVSCDYSQIELRVLAHLSKDEKLTQAFRNGEDVHTRTACEVFGLEPGEVDQEERRVAKAVNFGVIYGQSAFGLAKQLRIPRREASQYIERYFERYQGVATFMDELIEGARASGRVSTILGRRRPLPGLARGKGRHRSAAERMARNTPIQGSAADLIKLAMLRCQHRLEQDFPSAKMVLSVHDELVFEVEADRAEDLGDAMAHEMEGVWPLDVPLVVDVGVGNDWEEAH
jgi:DNA polymerase-1